MAFIGARIPDPLAARFEALALAKGGKSRLLRSLMEAALGEAAPASPSPPRARSTKVTLRLGPDELDRLDAACLASGLRRTEWLKALARRHLLGRPHFTRAAEAALLDIRQDLRRISVNARELAEAARHGDLRGAVEAERLRADVRAQLEGVRRAIEGNLADWDL